MRILALREPSLPVPNHSDRLRVAEQLDRIRLVDVADESVVDPVAAQAFEALLEAAGDFARNAELLILLLTDVRLPAKAMPMVQASAIAKQT